jgi:hypothetical protein
MDLVDADESHKLNMDSLSVPVIPDAPATTTATTATTATTTAAASTASTGNHHGHHPPTAKSVKFMKENDINNLRFSLERVLSNIGPMAPAVTMGVIPVPAYGTSCFMFLPSCSFPLDAQYCCFIEKVPMIEIFSNFFRNFFFQKIIFF